MQVCARFAVVMAATAVLQFIKLLHFVKSQFSMIQRAIAPKPRVESVRQRVYLELRSAMEQGAFKPRTRLPASREQAKTLGVCRNSVLWAPGPVVWLCGQ